jgi:hypothetical protein
MIRIATLAVLLACGTSHPQPAPAAAPPPPAETDRLRVRAAPDHDLPIDATFDQEARGGRPTWTPPPAVVARIRFTLESLAPSARRCFAGRETRAVDVRLVVTAGGRAGDVVVESADPRPRECLTGVLRRARFPVGRRAWRVDYVFRP